MFVARIETPSCSVLGSVVVIGLGTLVAAHGEVRFVWRGVLAMSASQFTEASKLVLMQLLLRGQRLGPLEGLLCFSPFACLSLLVGVVALELPGLRDGGLAMMAEHPFVFLGQAALGFLVNLLTILTVKLTSSISFKLISMAKNAAIVLLSVPVFHNKISPTQALGYSVTVLGFGWYSDTKLTQVTAALTLDLALPSPGPGPGPGPDPGPDPDPNPSLSPSLNPNQVQLRQATAAAHKRKARGAWWRRGAAAARDGSGGGGGWRGWCARA